jgi:hypothetical protein
MEIGRRKFMAGSAGLGLIGLAHPIGLFRAGPGDDSPSAWHPLTQSLLDRAARAAVRRTDTTDVQSKLANFAQAQGLVRSPAIKWFANPADAVAHLGRMGLDVLLAMGEARLSMTGSALSGYAQCPLL